MPTVYRVEIDRVVLHDVALTTTPGPQLRRLIEREIAARLEQAPLPAGRTASTGVRFDAPALSLASPEGIQRAAGAVAEGVSRAVSGPGGGRASRRTARGWGPGVRGEQSSGRASRRTARGWGPGVRGEQSRERA